MLTTTYELIPSEKIETGRSKESLKRWIELMKSKFPNPSIGDITELYFNGIRKLYKCIKVTDGEPYWQKVKEVVVKVRPTGFTQKTVNKHGISIEQLAPLTKRLVMENKIGFDAIKTPYCS